MTTVSEKERTVPPPPQLTAAVAADGPTATAPVIERLALAEELLDGDEIILLAIKPSPWFVLFDAARWMVFGALLLVVSAIPSLRVAGLTSQSVVQLACLIIVVRLAIAFLRWVSRIYVLTNRRVMRLRGVFRTDILSCPLVAIRNTRVSVGLHERLTRLGTILLFSQEMPDADLHWHQIAKCEEVHARVRRAIERAFDNRHQG